jgi:putative oxidoreductase
VNLSIVTVGRMLLGLFFVTSGVLQFIGVTEAGGMAILADYIGAHGLPLPQLLAALVIAFEVLAGLAVVAGRFTGPAGFLLAAFCIATAFIFHKFWTVPIEQVTSQLYHFMKNLGLTGAFLMVAGHNTRSS